jgi:hypothetical protein
MTVRFIDRIAGLASAFLALVFLTGTCRAGGLVAIASFDGANGSIPQSTVTLDAQGDLFGTAKIGGSGQIGTAWEFTANSVPEPSSIFLAVIGAASAGVDAAIRRLRHLPIISFSSPTVR